MIHAEDFRENPLQLAPAVLTGLGPLPKEATTGLKVSVTERVSDRGELTLSGSHVLLGVAVAMGSLSLFIWALVRLWLFGR
jgi:hypothetical protein